MNPTAEFLAAEDVAALYRMTVRWVYGNRELKAVAVKVGKFCLYRREDIDRGVGRPKRSTYTKGASQIPFHRKMQQTFRAMVDRCTNEKNEHYHNYGGRGILCLFKSQAELHAHIGDPPTKSYTVDRINNDGNYEIGNVGNP